MSVLPQLSQGVPMGGVGGLPANFLALAAPLLTLLVHFLHSGLR
jgi:hypothetical protein